MNPNSKIAVLGYGVEGRSTYDYLTKHGYKHVTVVDSRTELTVLHGCALISGPGCFDRLLEFDVIFRTPGISYDHPALKNAREGGVEVTSQLEYFLKHAKGITIGITGTKGKTTTSTFLHHVLKEAGRDAYLVGNMGNGMLDVLDQLDQESISVMELSSFQLMGCRYSPHIAISLAVTPEHLDYHRDLEEYYAAKGNIVRYQSEGDICICYEDNPVSQGYSKLSLGQLYTFSPEHPVRRGAYLAGEHVVLTGLGFGEEHISLAWVSLPGKHQHTNLMPGILVARLLGADLETIAAALATFRGVEHRLEYVGNSDGVDFYNDSAGTTPEAALAALCAMKKPTWMILGGSDKGVSFTSFAEEGIGSSHLRGMIFLGRSSGPKIRSAVESALRGRNIFPLFSIDLFDELPELLATHVKDGEAVVLSPAAASFDQFESYKARGEAFRALAKKFKRK